MKRSWWLAGLALVLGLASGPRGWAKPPDLPADNQIECPEFADDPVQGRFSIELGLTPKGVTLKIDAGLAMPDTPAVIDALGPNIVPAYVDALLARLKGMLPFANAMRGSHTDSDRERQMTQLFEVGEIYRRTGHFASARIYFQRVRQTAPTSQLGRLALERINEIEERLRDAEESSEADPEALFQELRDRTIPLGLAQQATY